MKAQTTHNGISLEYFNEIGNITFYIEGTHDTNEDYYCTAVNARQDENGNIWVEGIDANGYEYNTTVKTVIKKLSHYKNIFFE